MLYSTNKQFLFIHIYKTGGNSIRKILEPWADGYTWWYQLKGLTRKHHVLPSVIAPKHANARILEKALGKATFDKAFKFAFVRNPWDWQVSLYHFALKDKTNQHHQIISGFTGFEAYIEWRVNNALRLQKELISDEAGRMMIDFVGRFEKIQTDFDYICQQLELPQRHLPKLNQSKRKPYQAYYNGRTAEMVLNAYAEDIKTFGYRF